MKSPNYKYKKDLYRKIGSIMGFFTFVYTLSIFYSDRFLPYYLGALPIFCIASIAILILRYRQVHHTDTFNIIGVVLPIATTTAVYLSYCTDNIVFGISMYGMMLFATETYFIEYSPEEDIKGINNLFCNQLAICMLLLGAEYIQSFD